VAVKNQRLFSPTQIRGAEARLDEGNSCEAAPAAAGSPRVRAKKVGWVRSRQFMAFEAFALPCFVRE
jgi:hypothetical protein